MSRPDRFRTINFRLSVLYAAVFSVSACFLGLVMFLGVRTSLEQQLRQQITAETAQLLGDYRDDGLDELRHDIRERQETGTSGRLLYFLAVPDGRILFDDLDVLPPAGWHLVRLPGPEARQILIQVTELENGYVLGIAADRAPVVDAERAVLQTFGGTFLLALCAGAIGGVWLSRRFLAQIETISRAASRIDSEGMSARLPVAGTGDELDHLVTVINAMLARIEQLVINLQQVSSNIAHDLRTPLGHVRQTLEITLATLETGATEGPLLVQRVFK